MQQPNCEGGGLGGTGGARAMDFVSSPADTLLGELRQVTSHWHLTSLICKNGTDRVSITPKRFKMQRWNS